MFSNNHHHDGHVAVTVPAAIGIQEMLIKKSPRKFYRPPYVGVRGWVGIEVARVTDKELGLRTVRLPADDRRLILRYYSQERQAKIHLHKEMAEELGITINTLRLRVLRMKEKLQPCIERCLERTELF